jgi:DNA-binding SARP family transcriptional activator
MVVYQATSALRRALEPELPDRRFPSRYLEVGERLISLRLPPGSWLDFQAFEQASRKKDWGQALSLYAGELLPEYRYADWSIAARESLSEHYRDALLAQAEAYLASQDWANALDLARRLIALDPWHEAAVMVAMRACQGLNDLSGARRCYKRLEKSLEEELGVAPQEDLQTLYRSFSKKGH